jgi:CRP-like cAMP-binding protein
MSAEVLKKLQRRNNLTEAERRSLAEAFGGRLTVPPREDVIGQGQTTDSVTMVLKGCACAHTSCIDGRRRILAVFFPGEVCNLSRLFHSRDTFAIRSLNACVFARAQLGCLTRAMAAQPALASALLHESVLEAAILRAWAGNLGRSSAHSRTAHLLCEFFCRSSHAGLAHGDGCPLPLTQTDMADALGLSIVQVNRVLQSFRRDKLLSLDRGQLRIHDFEGLADIGAFSPAYLSPEADPCLSASSAA